MTQISRYLLLFLIFPFFISCATTDLSEQDPLSMVLPGTWLVTSVKHTSQADPSLSWEVFDFGDNEIGDFFAIFGEDGTYHYRDIRLEEINDPTGTYEIEGNEIHISHVGISYTVSVAMVGEVLFLITDEFTAKFSEERGSEPTFTEWRLEKLE